MLDKIFAAGNEVCKNLKLKQENFKNEKVYMKSHLLLWWRIDFLLNLYIYMCVYLYLSYVRAKQRRQNYLRVQLDRKMDKQNRRCVEPPQKRSKKRSK